MCACAFPSVDYTPSWLSRRCSDHQVEPKQKYRRTREIEGDDGRQKSSLEAAQRSGFSCRLAALANAAERRAGSASKTQKSSDLARRKAVSYNPVLDGIRGTASHLRLWCDIRLVEGQKRELLRQHVFMHPCLELWLIGSLSRLEPILPNNRVRPEVLESPDITHQPL
jgi:hypothetical protein